MSIWYRAAQHTAHSTAENPIKAAGRTVAAFSLQIANCHRSSGWDLVDVDGSSLDACAKVYLWVMVQISWRHGAWDTEHGTRQPTQDSSLTRDTFWYANEGFSISISCPDCQNAAHGWLGNFPTLHWEALSALVKCKFSFFPRSECHTFILEPEFSCSWVAICGVTWAGRGTKR